MHAIIDHYGIEEAAVRAFLAGCDVLLICQERGRQVAAMQAVEAAINDGTITRARLEASLARVARLKQRFVTPYKPSTVSDAKLIVGCRTHKALLNSLLAAHQRLETASV
jgi:beta-N-acetylhexosaminidase